MRPEFGRAHVTIDAMGCQKAIARTITDGGGDYVLTVKDNQPNLLEDIQQAITQACENNFANLEYDTFETRQRKHGRDEFRSYLVLHSTEGIRHAEDWTGLTSIGMCSYERTIHGKTSHEVHYFIGSKKASARVYGQVLRNHWGIENSLHWQLDVTFHIS